MFTNKVKYCRDALAIRRIRYMMGDDAYVVDEFIDENGEFILIYNEDKCSLLLFKGINGSKWLAIFRTNQTISSYLYCLLAARIICDFVIIGLIGNSIDETNLLREAGFKLKLQSSGFIVAISRTRFTVNEYLPITHSSFLIEEEVKVPICINRK